MNREEIISFLHENLSLNVKTKSNYLYGGGYRTDQIVELVLCGEVISAATVETLTVE